MSNVKNQSNSTEASSQKSIEALAADANTDGDARADALVAELRAMQRKVAEILGRDVPEGAKSTKAA